MATKSIQLTNIAEELSKLWNNQESQKKTRASLFNLILYIQKNDYTSSYQALIKTVISKFPCRVILILSEESNEPYLKTSVSSETIGGSNHQVFCEIIQIEVAGELIERVPFIILPQILPDLPVYLLWTQDPSAQSIILSCLEPFTDRIIFDAGRALNLQNYSLSILQLIKSFHCKIGDLNWSACSGWRQLFVQIFNTSKALLSLQHSNLIHIYYNKNPLHSNIENQIEGAYFQAWLASRLNWEFQKIENREDTIAISYSCSDHTITVLLSPLEVKGVAPGTMIALEIVNETSQDYYNLKRDSRTNQVFVQYSEKDLCHLPYCSFLNQPVAGQEILEEIFHPSTGEHYQEMLTLFSTIPWEKKT